MSDEEKEVSLGRLAAAHAEKVKVRNERREARLAHNRLINEVELARREAYGNEPVRRPPTKSGIGGKKKPGAGPALH